MAKTDSKEIERLKKELEEANAKIAQLESKTNGTRTNKHSCMATAAKQLGTFTLSELADATIKVYQDKGLLKER